MAWSWSHTNEAYSAARDNLTRLPIGELKIIAAEWQAARPREFAENGFDAGRYQKALRRLNKQHRRSLEDRPRGVCFEAWREGVEQAVWDRMYEQATCTNGGWAAYACPWGCGPHLVSFTPEGEEHDSRYCDCRDC